MNRSDMLHALLDFASLSFFILTLLVLAALASGA
jgi:hypothetical protein